MMNDWETLTNQLSSLDGTLDYEIDRAYHTATRECDAAIAQLTALRSAIAQRHPLETADGQLLAVPDLTRLSGALWQAVTWEAAARTIRNFR